METVISTKKLLKQFNLLNPEQKQTVYAFMAFLLHQKSASDNIVDKQTILSHTSIWNEEDIAAIEKVMGTWRLETF